MLYEKQFLFSLMLTLITEVPIVVLIIKYFYKLKTEKNLKIIFVSAIASTLTLPYLWFILPIFILNKITYIFFGESLVIFTETIIYYQLLKLDLPKAFILSLMANFASIIIGVTL